MSIKVVVISDTHTQHRLLDIPECDLLIHSGDACGFGRLNEFADFANWFEDQKQAGTRIYVPGNHDCIVEAQTGMCRGMLPTSHMLINESITMNGLVIWGSPYTPEFCDWSFQGWEEGRSKKDRYPELRRLYESMPMNTDIAICHGPYAGTADETVAGDHVGSVELLRRLRSVEPRLFVCGHIHYSYGVHMPGRGLPLTVNAALSYDFGEEKPTLKPPVVLHFGSL